MLCILSHLFPTYHHHTHSHTLINSHALHAPTTNAHHATMPPTHHARTTAHTTPHYAPLVMRRTPLNTLHCITHLLHCAQYHTIHKYIPYAFLMLHLDNKCCLISRLVNLWWLYERSIEKCILLYLQQLVE